MLDRPLRLWYHASSVSVHIKLLGRAHVPGEKEETVRTLALKAAFVAVVVTGLLVSGCDEVSQAARTESERVELGGAESAQVQIAMGVGGLDIRGGAEDLLEAEFTYSNDKWKPEVDYAVRGDVGLLTISQPSGESTVGIPDVEYKWDLRFNSEVPMEMTVNMGVGGGELWLGDLNLGELNIEVGVGGADIDLTGDWETDLEASINGGVGGVNLTLPRAVGVRVEAEAGLGGVNAEGFNQDGDVYTNDAYGQTDVTLEITVEVGLGGVVLSQRG